MKKNTITADEYFLEQQNVCYEFLRTYKRAKDAEDLHKLRVAIKKIRALLLMLNKLQAHFSFVKYYAPYKKVYRHFGSIREEILHAERLKEDEGGSNRNNLSEAIILKFNKELRIAAPGYLKAIREAPGDVIDALHKLDRDAIYPYCKKLHKRIKSKWNHIKSDDHLHKFRKLLKQFMYCSNLLTAREKGRLLSSKGYRHLDKLQDQIGRLHDNVLLLAQVEQKSFKVSAEFRRVLADDTKELRDEIQSAGDKLPN